MNTQFEITTSTAESGSGQDMSEALEHLAVGQAYVSTPDHAAARKVFMARE